RGSPMKRWTVLFLVAMALLVGGYDWATEPLRSLVPVYPQAAARDPYLAARTLRAEWRHPTQRVCSNGALVTLPAPDTMLIMDQNRGDLGRDRVQALLDWLAAGGHLVISARPPHGDREHTDALLDALGISVHQRAPTNPEPDHPMAEL